VLLPGCWDSFMGGAVLAHLYARGLKKPWSLPIVVRPWMRQAGWLALLLPFVVALWIEGTPALASWTFLCETLEAISLAAATWYVFTGLGEVGNGVLENRHLVQVGKASYALYVFQGFLYFWLWHKVTKHYSAHLTPFVATCTFIAITAFGIVCLARMQHWGDILQRRVVQPLLVSFA
jgi:peptidoglycan/LPS O-acetylase OafA/YrhL